MGIGLNNVTKKEKNLIKMENPKLYALGSFHIDASNDSVSKLSHLPRAQEAFTEVLRACHDRGKPFPSSEIFRWNVGLGRSKLVPSKECWRRFGIKRSESQSRLCLAI